MRKLVNISKADFFQSFPVLLFNRWIIYLLLLFSVNTYAQIAAPDSLAFSDSVKVWKNLPKTDSFPDWQIKTIAAVYGEKINKNAAYFNIHQAESVATRTTAEEALALALQDSTAGKETLLQLKSDVKQAKSAEKKGAPALKEAVSAVLFYEKTISLEPSVLRKNLTKLQKKSDHLQQTYDKFTAPPPPQPAPEPEKPAVETPPVVEVPPVVTDTTANAATPVNDIAGESKSKKKKTKEKEPEKPQVARYNPETDVMLHPPVPPCVMAVSKKDEFTGSVYRQVQEAELFRYTNSVMKKVLPVTQPHIVCTAALASDAQGGTLWLRFSIKDANARRTFGSLPPKSIISLKFMNGEIMTLFNESTQEVKFDPEKGIAIFTGQYPFQTAILKKFEKMELDQIRVAWATGYEDYNVQQVGLLQQQASCLK